MDVLMLIGRILFGAFFFASGIGHFAKREMIAGFVRSSSTGPAGLQRLAEPVVLLTGTMLVAGSVMVAAGIYADLGALLLAAFVVPTTPLMHGFWKLSDPMQRHYSSRRSSATLLTWVRRCSCSLSSPQVVMALPSP